MMCVHCGKPVDLRLRFCGITCELLHLRDREAFLMMQLNEAHGTISKLRARLEEEETDA